jgi:hypothetical protein
MINDGMIKVDLIYHGKCEKSNAYELSLKQVQDWIMKSKFIVYGREKYYLFLSPFPYINRDYERDILSSTGVSVSLPIFSGGADLCEAHEKMEAIAGYCVRMDDFIATRGPKKGLVESLFWHLHS